MSSYYGIVFPEFWTGDTGRAIQEHGGKDAQILALYLMSCRYATMIGLFPLTVRDLRYETGLGLKGVVRGFDVLRATEFADYDAGTEHVWVREMAKFRLGLHKKSPLDADDKRVKGIQNLYDRLNENPFLEPFFDRYTKEVRLKKRRSCGCIVRPLQDVAPSKGLEGAYKPVNRKQYQVPGTETGKSTGAARRPVEISEGTFALYAKIAAEAREQSRREDGDESISNISAIFKHLCGQRRLAYDSELAARAIEGVMAAAAKVSA